jgi:hypothetical protein
MSSDEQALQKGKLLDGFVAAKIEMAANKSKANEIATLFNRIGYAFGHGQFNEQLDTDILQLPAQNDLRKLLSDARAAETIMNENTKLLGEMGVDVK